MTRITLDTNILFYAFDARDVVKQARAIEIIAAAAVVDCMLGLQVVGEFYVAAVRKLKMAPAFARDQAKSFLATFDNFAATATAHRVAAEEAAAGAFSYWDAVLLASAAQSGCTVIISEDMPDGARLGTVTICNPFAPDGLSDAAREALGIA